MTLAKALEFDDYEPKKHVTQTVAKKIVTKDLERLNTSSIIWYVIKRHKYGLIVNIFLAENIYFGLRFFGVV